MSRPRVALIATTWFKNSHADVLGRRLVAGYEWQGAHIDPGVQVVSAYLEQVGGVQHGEFRPDVGLDVIESHGVPRFATVAEAVGLGRGGVHVDGVVIIGEHGTYEENEFGQKLYPRRRLFDAAVSTMIGAGKVVPVFNDKHLSWNFTDARAMYDVARRLHIPLLAGSSLPLTWRVPTGTQWPLGAPMTQIVSVGSGPSESYGFHILEALQVHAERRAGGETGVRSVTVLHGESAARALLDGTVDASLVDAALATLSVAPEVVQRARAEPQEVFIIEYTDGTKGVTVNCDGMFKGFAVAARGPGHEMACQMWLQGGPEFGHFIFLARQVESLMVRRQAPYPLERTLLTNGILDAAMRARGENAQVQTPELAIGYEPAADVEDTGVHVPVPGSEH